METEKPWPARVRESFCFVCLFSFSPLSSSAWDQRLSRQGKTGPLVGGLSLHGRAISGAVKHADPRGHTRSRTTDVALLKWWWWRRRRLMQRKWAEERRPFFLHIFHRPWGTGGTRDLEGQVPRTFSSDTCRCTCGSQRSSGPFCLCGKGTVMGTPKTVATLIYGVNLVDVRNFPFRSARNRLEKKRLGSAILHGPTNKERFSIPVCRKRTVCWSTWKAKGGHTGIRRPDLPRSMCWQ